MTQEQQHPAGFAPLVALGVAAVVVVLASIVGTRALREDVDPHVALTRAWAQAMDATSVRSAGTLTLTGTLPRSAEEDRALAVTLAFDAQHARRADGMGTDVARTMTVNVRAPALGSPGVTLDHRQVGATQYVRIGALDLAGMDRAAHGASALLGALAGLLGERWVTFAGNDLGALVSLVGVATFPSPTDDDLRALDGTVHTYAREHLPLAFRADLGTERVSGSRAYHYRVGIAPDVVRGFLEVLATSDALALGDADRAALLAQYDAQATDAVRMLEGEVWVSTRRGDVVRLLLPFTLAENTWGMERGTVNLRWSDWNAPVLIEAPADALPFSIIAQLLARGAASDGLTRAAGASQPPVRVEVPSRNVETGSPPLPAFPGAGDRDGDGLEDLQEAFYGSDPARADTDGDGYDDGNEVNNGYSPTGPGRLFAVPFGN